MADPLLIGQIDIIRLILVDIFQISQQLITQYTTVQDQLLWLVLVPHVIIFLVLFSFGAWISPAHTGLSRVAAIVGYLVLVVSGWYGSWIVPIVDAFFTVFLISAILFFIVSRLVPPRVVENLGELGAQIINTSTQKGTERKKTESEIRALKRAMKELERDKNRPGTSDEEKAEISNHISELRVELAEKEEELRG